MATAPTDTRPRTAPSRALRFADGRSLYYCPACGEPNMVEFACDCGGTAEEIGRRLAAGVAEAIRSEEAQLAADFVVVDAEVDDDPPTADYPAAPDDHARCRAREKQLSTQLLEIRVALDARYDEDTLAAAVRIRSITKTPPDVYTISAVLGLVVRVAELEAEVELLTRLNRALTEAIAEETCDDDDESDLEDLNEQDAEARVREDLEASGWLPGAAKEVIDEAE